MSKLTVASFSFGLCIMKYSKLNIFEQTILWFGTELSYGTEMVLKAISFIFACSGFSKRRIMGALSVLLGEEASLSWGEVD